MSFRSSLFEAIDIIVNNYIENVATEYNLNVTDLKALWNKTTCDESSQSQSSSQPSSQTPLPEPKFAPIFKKPTNIEKASDIPDTASMSKMSKNELVDLCKAKGIKITGTKADLIDRLSSKEIVVVEKSHSKPPSKPTSKEPEVIKQLSANIPTVRIRKNVFGNFEHAETGFLFEESTKRVIGKQNDDGTISSLSKTDIDTCNKYKFQYEIPSNLNEVKDKITVSAIGGDDEEEEDASQINEDDLLEEEDEELSEEDYVSDE